MDEILEKKKKQLGIYAKVAAGDSTSLLEYMLDIEEYLDSIKERFDEITKGKLRDVDYERIISESVGRIPTPKDGEKPSPKELIDIILPLIPEVKDGNDAVVDYEKIISEVVSQIHIPEDGKDGKDGSPDTSEDIRNKLELLEGDERLSVNAISGLDKFALVSDLKNIRTTVVGGGSANVQVLKNGMPVGSGAALDFRGAGIASVTHDGHTGVITITGGGGGGGIQTITGDDSIDVDATDPENPIISLVNDADAPGNSKYYGTDGSGNKGFFTFPSGGAVAFSDLTGSPNDNAALSSALSAKAPTASPTFTGTVAVPATNFTVGASLPFSDSSGTLTLQNVDVIDSTTESTIEAAIDTLANLTSIQGRTVTLADAGADRIFGWDDSANAYVNLSAADALAALGVTATATELNYVDGVTSAVQTQLNGKAATSHTHTLTAVTDVTATASEVNVLDGITASTTELNYVAGVTSSIQTQLNSKQAQDALLDDISDLSDPNADRLMFWDDSNGKIDWLTLGSNLSITGTTLNASGRVGSTTSSATPSINTDSYDEYDITALAANITSMTTNLSGTPTNGQTLMLRFKDNGTARTITWGSSFISSGVATLLATTVISKTHYVGLRYDSTAAKWVCLAVDATGY